MHGICRFLYTPNARRCSAEYNDKRGGVWYNGGVGGRANSVILNSALNRRILVDGEYVQAIKKSELQKIAKAFKRNGGVIRQDEEAKTILAFKGVQAITFNAKTILLTEAPTRATVFEELIHTRQYREGRIESSARSRIVCEIEAKEKLLKYASAYRLTKAKIRETQKLLAADKRELVKLNGE